MLVTTEMATLKLIKEVSNEDKHCEDVETIIIHNDNVYTGANEGRVKVWSKDLKLLHDLKAHDYALTHMIVKDNVLYTASMDMTIKKWDLNNYNPLGTITGHEEAVRRLDKNDSYIFAGDQKGEVRMWNPDGTLKLTYEVVEEVWDMKIEGNTMYCLRDRDLVITERNDNSEKFSVKTTITGRAPLHIGENHVVLCDRTGRVLQVRRKQPPEFPLLHEIQGHELIITAIIGWDNYLVSGGWDNIIKIWDITTGKQISQCSVKATPNAIAVTKDGIYVAGSDGYIAMLKLT